MELDVCSPGRGLDGGHGLRVRIFEALHVVLSDSGDEVLFPLDLGLCLEPIRPRQEREDPVTVRVPPAIELDSLEFRLGGPFLRERRGEPQRQEKREDDGGERPQGFPFPGVLSNSTLAYTSARFSSAAIDGRGMRASRPRTSERIQVSSS